jgi:hypothetical protein
MSGRTPQSPAYWRWWWHSTRVLAEQLRRGADGRWPEQPETIAPHGVLRLARLAFTCRLREAYVQRHLG